VRPDAYRTAVGGRWEEVGTLQFEFLLSQGLTPEKTLLDVGCGALRGGVRFIGHLDPGNYCGIDISDDLLDAGRRELAKADLASRRPTLLLDDAFRFGRFERSFDYALAVSVFTHLPFNNIMRCLSEMERVLAPGGRFYATFYEKPGARLNIEMHYERNAAPTTIDADPFYYEPDIFRWAVEGPTLGFELIGDWDHPRNQQMMVFTKR
jgi:ubiquinone/menaquinone biosynthesis C-methylase UbiE